MKTIKNRTNRFHNGEETKGNYEAYINQVIVLQDEIKEDKNTTTDTIQFHAITMSNGRTQYERKAAEKLILYHVCMKTVNSYYKKRLKCFFKGDRRGRVDDFGTQGVVKFLGPW